MFKNKLKKNPVVADPFTAELPPVLYQKGWILLFFFNLENRSKVKGSRGA